jgi:hypothetical protein
MNGSLNRTTFYAGRCRRHRRAWLQLGRLSVRVQNVGQCCHGAVPCGLYGSAARFDSGRHNCTMGRQFFLDSLPRLIAAAEVAELADAHGSGPCARKGVGVRVPSSAPLFEYGVSGQARLGFRPDARGLPRSTPAHGRSATGSIAARACWQQNVIHTPVWMQSYAHDPGHALVRDRSRRVSATVSWRLMRIATAATPMKIAERIRNQPQYWVGWRNTRITCRPYRCPIRATAE